ncbi:MAG: DUF433 domain-containing protein [Prevotellaceae bacterium]|jgi:hypothetical protein|nr:DUF433 domain-containing protein [Prevotellaceae bacterium]
MNSYDNIIRIDSGKRFGKPCVRDTRITVYDVLGWLSAGMSHDEVSCLILQFQIIVIILRRILNIKDYGNSNFIKSNL